MSNTQKSVGQMWSYGGKSQELRNRSVNRFVIYDMDRKEWEKTKSNFYMSQRNQSVDQENVVPLRTINNQTHMLSEFRIVEAQPVCQMEMVTVPKQRRRAREMRVRLSEI